MPNSTTFPVSSGLLEPRHVQAIGSNSAWPVYLWFLNRVTRDVAAGDDFDGVVLYGNPIGVGQIAAELGMDYRACRRYIARLKSKGYIAQKRTGTGMCAYLVKKSKKWSWKRNEGGSTDQNHVCGSVDPPTKIMSVDGHPQTTFGIPTDQNRVGAIRNKPQQVTKNTKPQTSSSSEAKDASDMVNVRTEVLFIEDEAQNQTSAEVSSSMPASEEKKPRPAPSDEPVQLAELLRSLILQNNPQARITTGQLANWALEAERIMHLDGRTAEQTRELIVWSQADQFWHRNILSMERLRRQFDRLTLERNSKNNGHQTEYINRAEQRKNSNLAIREQVRRDVMSHRLPDGVR